MVLEITEIWCPGRFAYRGPEHWTETPMDHLYPDGWDDATLEMLDRADLVGMVAAPDGWDIVGSEYFAHKDANGLLTVYWNPASGMVCPNPDCLTQPDDGVEGDGVEGDGVEGDGVEGDGVEGDGVEGDGVEGDGVEGDGVEGDGVEGDGVEEDDRTMTLDDCRAAVADLLQDADGLAEAAKREF